MGQEGGLSTIAKLLNREKLCFELYSELEDWKLKMLDFRKMKALLGEKEYWPEAPVVLDFVVEKDEDPEVREYKRRLREMGIPEISDEEAKRALLQFGSVEVAICNYF